MTRQSGANVHTVRNLKECIRVSGDVYEQREEREGEWKVMGIEEMLME